MSGNSNNSPMLKAAGLWSKTSVKGGWYLAGRLGSVKVLVMENRDRQSDDGPSHHLFFIEAPDRRQDAQERSGGQRAKLPRTSQTSSQSHRSDFQGHGQRAPHHQAPLDHDDMPAWAR